MFKFSPRTSAKKRHVSPSSLLIRSFALLILIGTALLYLPVCHRREISLLDCFFISTSSVCVTGLSTIDFGATFNQYGELVVLILMQLGGMGLLAFALLAFRVIGAQLSLNSQSALTDSVLQKDAAAEFEDIFRKIIGLALTVEAIGALILTADRIRLGENYLAALWQGGFHAVSAFCNAGFTLWSDNLGSQGGVFRVVVMALVFLGGIGHLAITQIFDWFVSRFRHRKPRELISYNTRVVLWISLILMTLSSFVLWLDGRANITFANAAFTAVSSRTAGFTVFDPTTISPPNRLWIIVLMFIGGAPGSCAGGIKVTTFAIWLATCASVFRNDSQYVFFGRQIPDILVARARRLIQFSILWNIFGLFWLLSWESGDPLTLLFEQISAFGTVGLSLNFTPQLSAMGKLWLILSMFVGRLGPLTIALSTSPMYGKKYGYPEGRIMIG